jgi:lysophospholipase L1-like esterase
LKLSVRLPNKTVVRHRAATQAHPRHFLWRFHHRIRRQARRVHHENKRRLEKKGVADQYELIGAGISGNKVYDLYLRLEDDVIVKSPDVVVIYVEVNDVWHKTLTGTGTDADKFEKFYTAIIKKLQEKDIKLILCTPALIGERTDNFNQQDGDLNLYSQIIRSLVGKYRCSLCDLRKAFLEYNLKNNSTNSVSGILTTDKVHLNEKGNQMVAELLLPELYNK